MGVLDLQHAGRESVCICTDVYPDDALDQHKSWSEREDLESTVASTDSIAHRLLLQAASQGRNF